MDDRLRGMEQAGEWGLMGEKKDHGVYDSPSFCSLSWLLSFTDRWVNERNAFFYFSEIVESFTL